MDKENYSRYHSAIAICTVVDVDWENHVLSAQEQCFWTVTAGIAFELMLLDLQHGALLLELFISPLKWQ